jgi:hypothetical protein
MSAVVASPYPDPFESIISLPFPRELHRGLDDEGLKKIYDRSQSFTAPQPNTTDVVSSQLLEDNTYNQAIAGTGYSFQYDRTSLIVVSSSRQISHDRVLFSIYYILNSYASYCLIF